MREARAAPENTVRVQLAEVNISPDAFHMWATHFYKCNQDFEPPDEFSPVPYFLLCRAVELELKSRHLRTIGQAEVKNEFWHDLMRLYEGLDKAERILGDDEVSVLRRANEIYTGKGFEYFHPVDAMRGYSGFPDLDALEAIAGRLILRKKQEDQQGDD